MTRKDIICLPHSSLRKRSQKVSVFDSKLSKLVESMEEATLDWENHRQHEVGVALAAPQINVLRRIIVIRNDFDNKDDKSFLPLVNPKILRQEGRQVMDYEGCLSVPDIYGQVPRYEKIKIKAQDLDGQEFRLTAEGFLARVLQHEIDHTNGVMFVDYLKNALDAFYRLDDEGKLVPLKEDEIAKQADILWH
ncbi:MAG TPA: peptide deformylase [Candidatus Saccharimonadales bacterium]